VIAPLTIASWPARVELPLLDPQVRRKLGIVAAHFGDEALGVFACQEPVDGFAERMFGARSVVENHEDAHERIVSRARASATRVQRRSGLRLPVVVSGRAR
jgi:hypothetical protein